MPALGESGKSPVSDRGTATSPTLPCTVLGIDLSSRAIDLVLLDENEDIAQWSRVDLVGRTAWERLRSLRALMPTAGWYSDNGVYLIAVEMPESRMRVSLRAQLPVFGAVIASLPTMTEVWSLSPADWKRSKGLGNAKPTPESFPQFDLDDWSQDSLDALGVALYARDVNARAVADALGAA